MEGSNPSPDYVEVRRKMQDLSRNTWRATEDIPRKKAARHPSKEKSKLGTQMNTMPKIQAKTSGGAKPSNEGRSSPTQVQEIERLDEIVKQEANEMYRNEQKSCDDDNKTAQAHRKWICTLAHEFCEESINSVVEAKIPNYVECTNVSEYMKAVSIGYNNEMLSATESRNLLEQAKAAELRNDRRNKSCRAQEEDDRSNTQSDENIRYARSDPT